MFYAALKVSDHPCFEMQELIYSVFYSSIQSVPFGKAVFPDRFTKTTKLWNYLEGIRSDFEPLYADLLALDLNDRKKIYSQLIDNNMVERFCEDSVLIPDKFINYENGIGDKIKKVLINCYDKLDLSHFRRPGCTIKPRYRYYRDYIQLNKSVCPFCSINSYKNPLNPRREDFDHYLAKSEYPLSAANMDNLIPMCRECNQDFKKEKNILYADTNRVVAFYPFTQISGVNIHVNSMIEPTLPFTRSWQVDLIPKNPVEINKINNWDRVFSIKNRLANEITSYFEEWITNELEEKKSKFIKVSSFRKYMGIRSTKWLKASDRRMEPKAQLKMAFFKYIETGIDDEFIKSYIQIHNENIANK